MKKYFYLLVITSLTLPIFSAEDEEGEAREGIEEVIVTAEKREASIQDTAISITAFDETKVFAIHSNETSKTSSLDLSVLKII